ncbi:protein phosphatase 2C family protein [Tasmannia lanceolata]|uniref:protein phosphatase 2C family protein n=1 Tax=Tasmannia lanceolata TaxID=3420 RepID=UPI004062EA9F
MGNSTSRVVGCFEPFGHGRDGVDLDFLEPLDEGLGHSFCYVRPVFDSPAITPSNSERFTVDSSTLDSETQSGSFRREIVEDSIGLQRPNKTHPETTFKTISGASVSANVSTLRSVNQNALFMNDTQEPAASFESTSSFAAIPLQPIPRGSGQLNGFMSGPLERGFASGPLERGGGFMSGPIEKGVFMSGPLDSTDKTNFSAPLVYSRRRTGFGRIVRSMSRPMRNVFSRTFSRHSSGSGWMQRLFLHPMTQWHPKEAKFQPEVPRNCFEIGPSEGEYSNSRNLQWAHGKAGEDRVHVVLSEEQGWLFVGIYDGFSGPDAPDFLMSYLYRAIDKELEGLLWDYDDKPGTNPPTSRLLENDNGVTVSGSRKEDNVVSRPCEGVVYDGLEEPCSMENVGIQSNDGRSKTQSVEIGEIVEEKDDVEYGTELQASSLTNQDLCGDMSNRNADTAGLANTSKQMDFRVSTEKLAGKGRKSKRLYELLQMDGSEIQDPLPVSASDHRRPPWDLQPSVGDLCSRVEQQTLSCSTSTKRDESSCRVDVINPREDEEVAGEEAKHGGTASFSFMGHKQLKKSLVASNLRKMYRKQKSLRKKLFPWSYDWHRDNTQVDERMADLVDSSAPIRRCKSGPVDHVAVLEAMSRALENTEEAYMEMVETSLDRNPELALMGSCVLVMLMKDQDVYVMNLGDSRVILAQERLNDRHGNPNVAKDDARQRNKSRESLVRVELDRISEESPMHNQTSRVSKVNKSREISICRLKMRAVQLSTDHSTSVEEEVLRIKAEHADDNQAILNDRVKGQLNVTRAFGAGFLKKPKCNETLLEMFRIDYIGNSPYVSCIPFVVHHRLRSNDRFLVLSSDGLYQYFSNEEVVSHVAWFMDNVPEGDPAQYLIAELLFRAAKKNGMDFHELLDIPHGDRRKYHDDVSVMVISLEGRIWRSSG